MTDKIMDLHCDTVSKLAKPWHRGNLMQNPYSVDVQRMEQAGITVQCFSTFFFSGWIPRPFRETYAYHMANQRIRVFDKNVKRSNGGLLPIKNQEDICRCVEEGKAGGLLTLEDGVPLGKKLERVEEFYEKGIRLITLTWNYENAIGFPNSSDPEIMGKGLKSFGMEILEEMERLGMVVDVSHLSDGGFWDVVKHSNKPFIASHSNARSITVHPRNLTDSMIKAIADKGGVIGLNFCPRFLGTDNRSSVANMMRHVKHIYDVGGEDVLALGTDFDGITGKLQIAGCEQLSLLWDALQKHKMSSRVISKMQYENAFRVLKDTL